MLGDGFQSKVYLAKTLKIESEEQEPLPDKVAVKIFKKISVQSISMEEEYQTYKKIGQQTGICAAVAKGFSA